MPEPAPIGASRRYQGCDGGRGLTMQTKHHNALLVNLLTNSDAAIRKVLKLPPPQKCSIYISTDFFRR